MRPLSALGLNLPKKWTATMVIVGVLGTMALVTLLFPVVKLALAFVPQAALGRPWTLITYPLTITVIQSLFGPLLTVFLLVWTYQIGSSVEREQGLQRYLGFWAIATVLPALLMLLPGAGGSFFGPSMPIAALTVAWATRNANVQVMLMGIIAVQAKWIGVLFALGTFTQNLNYGPFAAVLAMVSLGITWAWAAERIPALPYHRRYQPSKAEAKREIDFMKEVAKKKDERAEKERLRRLLEGGDDPLSR